jgi:hypothetical protein
MICSSWKTSQDTEGSAGQESLQSIQASGRRYQKGEQTLEGNKVLQEDWIQAEDQEGDKTLRCQLKKERRKNLQIQVKTLKTSPTMEEPEKDSQPSAFCLGLSVLILPCYVSALCVMH